MSIAEAGSAHPHTQATDAAIGLDPFRQTLEKNGLELTREKAVTLQINTGLLCNLECGHCHLEAGPKRNEIMSAATMDDVAALAQRGGFEIADITGGAPEMNPNLEYLIEKLAPHVSDIWTRTNLTAISGGKWDELVSIFKKYKVVLTASFPSLNRTQSEAQRGDGVFDRSVEALKKLNAEGYGAEGSGLSLNLVSNPVGAFLPSSQESQEKKFKADLKRKFGVEFNNLFVFANAPLGRYKNWLEKSGNLDTYLAKLADSFNPCAVPNLMCRTLVSVDWDGYLYDCDFNLANGLPLGGKKTHISEIETPPEPGAPIATSDYCYTCSAGGGFT